MKEICISHASASAVTICRYDWHIYKHVKCLQDSAVQEL